MFSKSERNISIIIWTTVCLLYLLFIAFFSYLYPYGIKEYAHIPDSLLKALEEYFTGYLQFTSRLGFLFTTIILYLGKWSFIIINPLVQLGLVILTFFFVFMRWPDFERTKDIYVFMLIALLTVFAVTVPGNTVFWISGACSYRWVFLVFLSVLCLFRLIIEHEYTLPDNLFTKILMLFAGFIVGMSNKSNGPMGVIVFIGFYFYCKCKKIETPSWFFWGLTGLVAGVIALFYAPGPYKNPNTIHYDSFRNMTLKQKLILHLPNFNDFLFANLLLPVITIFGMGLAVWDKKYTAIKNIDFICSVVCWLLAITTALLLFIEPTAPLRTFYAASMFSIFSFIFIIKYLKGNYAFNIYKYLFAAALALSVIIFPSFAEPYLNLYSQEQSRTAAIKNALEKQLDYLWCDELIPSNGPTKNLSITFFDVLSRKDTSATKHFFGVQLINNKEIYDIKSSNEVI